MSRPLIIGSRGSALALWQARAVEIMLREGFPDRQTRIEIINTTGDRTLDSPLAMIGGKGLFTRELESALLTGRIDLAVHSLKDMQTRLPDGLRLAAVTARHRAEDALVAPSGATLESLPRGGTVATGSARRGAQLLWLRPDLKIVDVRGNVPTRLVRYHTHGWDGMILAAAGLDRLELSDQIAQIIPASTMIPAVGQGALGIESRDDDAGMLAMLKTLEHRGTRLCTDAERGLLRTLEGGCSVPVGAHATLDGQTIRLAAVIAATDGSRVMRDEIAGDAAEAEALGMRLGERMIAAGGRGLLGG